LATQLAEAETTIVDELNSVQGNPVDLGGYYWPKPQAATDAMRPSATLKRHPRRVQLTLPSRSITP
jgi:isocitrate dehydrogenase